MQINLKVVSEHNGNQYHLRMNEKPRMSYGTFLSNFLTQHPELYRHHPFYTVFLFTQLCCASELVMRHFCTCWEFKSQCYFKSLQRAFSLLRNSQRQQLTQIVCLGLEKEDVCIRLKFAQLSEDV